MKYAFLLFLTYSIGISSGSAQFNSLKKDLKKAVGLTGSSKLSQDEISKGLKEALTTGVDKSVARLSKPDGYFKDPEIKIPMPSKAKSVESKLRQLGQGKRVDDAVESINRAAEDAAVVAKNLFVNAIKAMTLTDAKNILQGNDDAATQYLSKSTRPELIKQFTPHIKTSLDKVGATKHWETVFSTYNKIPFVQKVETDLVGYTTEKAIQGLFIQVAKEELNIRENPSARATDLLKKVFGN